MTLKILSPQELAEKHKVLYSVTHRSEMTLDEAQREVARTLPNEPDLEKQLAILAMGLAGEAGEVVDLLKKSLGHGHPLDKEKLLKELGDVDWYKNALLHVLDMSASACAMANQAKLRERYPEGFDPARSQNRQELEPSPVVGRPRTAKHGTRSMYSNNACRCDLCRAANREYSSRLRAKRKREPVSDDELTEQAKKIHERLAARAKKREESDGKA